MIKYRLVQEKLNNENTMFTTLISKSKNVLYFQVNNIFMNFTY